MFSLYAGPLETAVIDRQRIEVCCCSVPLNECLPCSDPPSVNSLNRCAAGWHCTAAGLLLGGVIAISVTAHSALPDNVKIAAGAISGLVMVGACLCCRLSRMYDQQSFITTVVVRGAVQCLDD